MPSENKGKKLAFTVISKPLKRERTGHKILKKKREGKKKRGKGRAKWHEARKVGRKGKKFAARTLRQGGI